MSGIRSCAVYIPMTRLPLSVIAGKPPKDGGPEKAVAWMDEDSVTLGVAAARQALCGIDRAQIDGVIFASTTWSFSEKQAASVIAKVLNLRSDVRTVDVSGSTRAGTQALQSAIDAVKAGSANNVLVIAADCRMGAPGSGMEQQLGDGAAAFVISNEQCCATLNTAYAHNNEILDIWRKAGDRFVHSWEDRFINQHGYTDSMLAAIQGLFSKSGKTPADITKGIFYAPDARSHTGVAKAAGVKSVQDPLFGKLGNTGAAFGLMQLVAALEEAKAGDTLLLANYGDGADALLFTVSATLAAAKGRRSVSTNLAHRRVVDSYQKYLTARNLTIDEYPAADEPGISATVHFRERDEDLSLMGQVCGKCGTHQFPRGRVCVRCRTKDNWAAACYSEATGKVITYTFDAFFPSPEPPTVVTITEVVLADGKPGPRIHMQFTEGTAKDMTVDLPVEFTFRCIHRAGLRPNYFWKCAPATRIDGGAQ